MKKLVILLVGVFLIMISACSKAADTPQETVTDKAIDFTLSTVGGSEVTLSELLKDKPVVLEFWATWCGHCVKSAPRVEQFYQENKDKVTLISVNIKESKAKVRSFIEEHNTTYPVALDSDAKVAATYNVSSIPTIVAIDKNWSFLYYGHSIDEMIEKVKF